jgi:hypothetical protein
MRYIINLLFVAIIASSGAFVFSADVKAQPVCTGVIEVETIPDSSTEFPFTVTGDFPEEFTLEPNDGKKLTINGTITVTQGDVDGWVLRDIVCGSGNSEMAENEAENGFDNSVSFSIVNSGVTLTCDEPGGFAVCTFINSRTETVPTISQWGAIALVLGLGAVGYFVIHRRKATA